MMRLQIAKDLALAGTGEKVKWGHCRLLLVGQGRAGKTSTLKALTEQAFEPFEKRTLMATTNTCEIHRTDLEVQQRWKVIDKAESSSKNYYYEAIAVKAVQTP